MKKRMLSLFLALVLCLGLLPMTASAAETNLPDWYFLFAIFKNVDADVKDSDGNVTHQKYTMTQEKIDHARSRAKMFEEYMDQVGVMRAHVDVVEIDTPVTELKDRSGGNDAYLSSEQAALLLKGKVDLDRYDHVTCIVDLNVRTGYLGVAGSGFENGTGHSCINFFFSSFGIDSGWPSSAYVHEFLHFMENMDRKWGAKFGLHDIRIDFYTPDEDYGKECYTAIIQNRAKGDAGTGVHPIVWQYPPHVLRTMTKLAVPSSVNSIGTEAFRGYASLTEVTIPSGLTSIGVWAFGHCPALTKVTIPASVTSIGYAAFYDTGIKDVYYAGTEAQWNAIDISSYNGPLTSAAIHYNSLMADVKTSDWFAQSVAWALENGVTNGTGNGNFSPERTCNQGEILTFLWRAKGSPTPAGAVTDTQFYAKAVQWAKEQGLVGVNLNPNSPCTRADVVAYLWQLAGNPEAKAASFTDVPADAGYAKAVSWAKETGITSGVSATRFAPDRTCTRGEIVTFLYRALAE